ncbi:protein of unknown function (DUF4371) [Popillia japonica]|uniref:DUF4371 domain-containing protein n=1 Tax=Popillia japonica TaxID=7064 RepID=A0AAW1JWJ9_POPJA
MFLEDKASVVMELSTLRNIEMVGIFFNIITPDRVQASKKIQDIPLSNNTVKARIDTMSNDIEDQLVCEIKKSPYFSLQCDESTDVAQCCQLLVFVRYLGDNNTIKEELLISQELETTSKGKDVMKIICDYFERHGIEWKRLAGFCTDGAPAMLGSRSGLATLVKEKNPSTVTMHCIIHRQALASKTLPEDLSNTMKLAIKMVNAVKSSALNSRIFRKLCAALDSEYETLLFHTEVRWLSKAKVEEKNFQSFPTLKTLADDGDYATVTDEVQHNVLSHLGTLMDEFARYFPEYGSSETEAITKLIRNP